MANQWLEMKQCGEWGWGRGLTLYPANKKGASASAILTVEATRRLGTDRVRNVVACVRQTPLPRLPPITQENVCQGGKRPDSYHCKSDTPSLLQPRHQQQLRFKWVKIEALHPPHHFEDEPHFQLDNLWGVRDTQPKALIIHKEVKIKGISSNQHF